MQKDQIEGIIRAHLYKIEIESIEIKLGPNYNPQVDKIVILFNMDKVPSLPWKMLGELIDALETYTQEDNYGDITELKFKWLQFYKGKDNHAWIFDINIDS